MKRFVAVICVMFLIIAYVGCGTGQNVNGKYCDTYGFLNEEDRCEEVQYKIITGNFIWGIILVETVIAPLYFFGFSLYEPVSKQEK